MCVPPFGSSPQPTGAQLSTFPRPTSTPLARWLAPGRNNLFTLQFELTGYPLKIKAPKMTFVVLSSIHFDEMNWTRIRSGDSDQVSEILSKGLDAKLLLKDVQEDTPHFAGI
jgi:hypothetical protein